ncbi:bifunctional Zinc finger [Babesia duncani]|uniref:Bifunctional Zinc finger n=1 Tax=Babesia duncani TaxID=323732 RepID=A0AAD9PHS4_9APIC|nr:bifunctional Zinc finger [Babesia duncani]KAK2196800.1 bifunctional Zinc finger [Babesia duncani]
MQHRTRTEKLRLPSDHYIEFSRYKAPVYAIKPRVIQPQCYTKAYQRNLRCYVTNNGLTLEQLPIERPSYSVDWAHVDFVDLLVNYNDPVICPICLDDVLVAPRIAACSHAFCWVCILKYLNFSTSGSRKPCPLCQTSIEKSSLKPVRFQLKRDVKMATFALMAQEEFSLGVSLDARINMLLTGSTRMRKRNEIPHYYDLDIQFWDLAYGNDRLLQEMLQQDYKVLHKIASDPTTDKETLAAVQEALQQLPNELEQIETDENANAPENVQSAIQNLDILAQSVDPSWTSDELSSRGTEKQRRKCFCFYQSIDGQKLLLHPKLTRFLWRCYDGNINALPLFLINLPILSMVPVIVTPELRRRIKFLHHFRLGTQVQLVTVPLDQYMIKPVDQKS